MKRTGHVFGFQHTPTGLTLIALGFGVLLCTTLEAMEVGLGYRNMVAVLLIAISGAFVRRRATATRVAG